MSRAGRSAIAHGLALTLALTLAVSACTPPSPEPRPPPTTLSCAVPYGYDALAEAVADDVFVDVDAVDVDVAGESAFVADLVFWMLDRRRDDATFVAAADAEDGPYATAVFAAVRASDGAGVDDDVLAAGLARFAACTPADVADLDSLVATGVDLSADAVDETVDSAVKGTTRALFRSATAGAFVAQTVRAGVVEETEALLTDRRRDGSFDIVVYGADGARRVTSTFAAPCASRADLSACVPGDVDRSGPPGTHVVAGAPLSCLRCHHSASGGFFDVTPAP